MLRTAFALWLSFAGIAAITAFALLTQGHGPIGWLNALQQWIFGEYSTPVSLLVLWSAILIGFIPLQPYYDRYLAARAKPVTAGFVDVPESNAWILVALVFIVPTIWACGFLWYAWIQYDLRQDLAADYQAIDLTAGPAPDHVDSHRAIKGRFVFSSRIEHRFKHSNTETTYVPLVEPGWVKGQPVRFIAEIKNMTRLKDDLAVKENGGRVLFADDGSVPDTMILSFRDMGVVTNSATMVLRVVESKDGKALTPVYGSYRPDPLLLFWLGSTVLSVLITLCAFTTYFAQNRYLRERQRAAGAS